MRVDETKKSCDITARDIYYMLGSYIRYYLMINKEDPAEIVFPMLTSTPHPVKAGVTIPIRYVLPSSPEAMEVEHDVSNIPAQTTQADEDKADQREESLRKTAEAIEKITDTFSTGNDQPPSDRVPKQPEHPATGSPDNMGSRMPDDEARIARDLEEGSGDPGGETKPFEKKIGRGSDGEPLVEEV
jgi:hypothetical protein